MKILLNLGTLRGHGSRTVGMDALLGLCALAHDDLITAWIPDTWHLPRLPGSVSIRYCKGGAYQKFWTENWQIPSEMARADTDVLFSCGDTGTLFPKRPHLLLVQQAYLGLDPSALDFPVPKRFRVKLHMMQKYFATCLPRVDRVVVQSDYLRDSLMSRWSLPSQRVVVIPSAVDVTMAQDRLAVTDKPSICYISSPTPHKNHDILPDMVAVIAKSIADISCQLTVNPVDVPRLVDRARQLDVLNHFEFHGSQSHGESLKLLERATVAIMPSKLESFGIPYYEAMALGKPQVVADRPFAREACGPAALYAHPNSGEEFAIEALRIFESQQVHDELSAIALARYREFRRTPAEVASRYRDLLREMLIHNP